ncbi:sterol desaturase family protein [Cupriavidus basilensis]|uniref:sterol desaturase family protein n=1 Tax=Cupriavidus basilensis TaxID=68895 RepID=UPI00157AFAC9|nr:sterol desaturase family protein [Cupriavidus basilensis]NUA26031.1 sterol desaturase family protein [Cupriavidus basilensis]
MTRLEILQLYALPVVVGASLMEALVLHWRKPGTFDWHEARLSLVDLAGRKILVFLPLSLAAPVFALAWEHRLQSIVLNSWLLGVALFIGQEFCYYWYHRAAHRVRFFWATHAVHHSPNQLTLSTAYRLGWTGKLTGTTLFFTPLVWLGFPSEVVIATLSLNLLYQFWIHATWIPRLGWLEYVLNTPSAHRVHHAANIEYLDANFGGVLIVFDRLFGTYVAERSDLPCRYGLVTPMRSRNPLRVEFQQWLDLGRDLAQARSLGAMLGFLFLPPGWRPDGQGHTTEALRRQLALAGPLASEGSGAAPK